MTDHAAVVQGMAAGVGGSVLALLGVDAQQLTAALIACSLGTLLAPSISRWRAVPLFFAAVAATAIAASGLAPVLAAWWPGVSMGAWSKLVALGVGIWLHPLIQAGSTLVPRLADWLMGKLGERKEGTQ